MGIRVSKRAGYALLDFKGEKDPRLKLPDSFKGNRTFTWETFEWIHQPAKNSTWLHWSAINTERIHAVIPFDAREDYIKLMIDTAKEMIESRGDLEDQLDYPIWEMESSSSNILLFQSPLDKEELSRYADTLDWLDETAKYATQDCPLDHFELCEYGIYPYSDFVRIRPPKESYISPIDRALPGIQRDELGFTRLSGADRRTITYYCKGDKAWIADHLAKDFRHQIDPLVAAYILYLDMFTNPKEIIDQLQPIIWTYWS